MAETQSADAPAPDTRPRDLGPDGEKIKDMTYYDLLDVRGDATDIDLKKAFRKKALLYHPDKNPGNAEAQQKFVEVGEAMQILSNPQERAYYNKNGKRDKSNPDAMEMVDPGKLFAHMFGGEAFRDWIGEISLGKDIGKAFEVSTTEEEREQMKAEWASATQGPHAKPQDTIGHEPATVPDGTTTTSTPTTPPSAGSGTNTPTTATTHTLKPSSSDVSTSGSRPPTKPTKMTPEQRAELEKYERQRREEQIQRVYHLTTALITRLRPFVEAHKRMKGSKNSTPSPMTTMHENEEIERWEKGIREEAEDLKMESFGVELLRLIGSVYASKATSYMKLHRPKSLFANFLGLPKFVESTKQTGKNIKEVWGMLSTTMDVQSSMQEFEKLQEKGEVSEEELEALSKDLMGKLLLVSWKGTRFESGAILRQVVDNVLSKYPLQPPSTPSSASATPTPAPGTPKSPTPTNPASTSPPASQLHALVDEETLWFRAKGLLAIGMIFKQVQPDETDEERRELERLVTEASKKKSSKSRSKATASATANTSNPTTTTGSASARGSGSASPTRPSQSHKV